MRQALEAHDGVEGGSARDSGRPREEVMVQRPQGSKQSEQEEWSVVLAVAAKGQESKRLKCPH